MKPQFIICDNCGKQAARIIKSSRCYGRGKNLLVIKNIPWISCRNCYEVYMTAATAHEVDRIRLSQRAKPRTVLCADYAKAS
jgi:YgiT-type zinc finger domain-containing protein